MVELRCTHRAGFGSGGSCTVPGQGYDDIALLSSPVDHHLVVRVVQVGLQEKNRLDSECNLCKRQVDIFSDKVWTNVKAKYWVVILIWIK